MSYWVIHWIAYFQDLHFLVFIVSYTYGLTIPPLGRFAFLLVHMVGKHGFIVVLTLTNDLH